MTDDRSQSTTDRERIEGWAREHDSIPVRDGNRLYLVPELDVSDTHERADWETFHRELDERGQAVQYHGDREGRDRFEIVDRHMEGDTAGAGMAGRSEGGETAMGAGEGAGRPDEEPYAEEERMAVEDDESVLSEEEGVLGTDESIRSAEESGGLAETEDRATAEGGGPPAGDEERLGDEGETRGGGTPGTPGGADEGMTAGSEPGMPGEAEEPYAEEEGVVEESRGEIRVIPTDEDNGKRVVDANGEEIGLVTEVDQGVAYIDPHPSLTAKIMARLDWSTAGEDDYPLRSEQIARITDDTIELSSGGVGGDEDIVTD